MSLKRSSDERRIDSQVFGREYHVQRKPVFRLAGRVFQESDEKMTMSREKRQSLQKSRPYGVGFGTDDLYGPDESWDSPDSLRSTHGQDHYIVGQNHGFSVDSFQ